jgi:hypothetical protein
VIIRDVLRTEKTIQNYTTTTAVYIRQAGAYYSIAATPSLEPKHELHTHPHTHTQILTGIQPPIGALEVISGSRQT